MPPSPRWLISRACRSGSAEESDRLRGAAADALRRFRRGIGPEEVESELLQIEAAFAEDSGGGSDWKELLAARRPLIAGCGLISLQQLTGQPSVLYYQEAIFRDAGFGEFASSASVVIGAAKLLATLFTVRFVDSYGRRPLLFAGISMMLAALVVLSLSFGFSSIAPDGSVHLASGWSSLLVAALILYVCGYQVGFGPIAWLIISEVFPLRSRTRALSCAVSVNFAFNLLMTFTLQHLQDAFDAIAPGKGQAYLFLLYACFCILSIAFVKECVPETKGKTLEQIEEMMLSAQPRRF